MYALVGTLVPVYVTFVRHRHRLPAKEQVMSGQAMYKDSDTSVRQRPVRQRPVRQRPVRQRPGQPETLVARSAANGSAGHGAHRQRDTGKQVTRPLRERHARQGQRTGRGRPPCVASTARSSHVLPDAALRPTSEQCISGPTSRLSSHSSCRHRSIAMGGGYASQHNVDGCDARR
jgi:hypothetical protein